MSHRKNAIDQDRDEVENSNEKRVLPKLNIKIGQTLQNNQEEIKPINQGDDVIVQDKDSLGVLQVTSLKEKVQELTSATLRRKSVLDQQRINRQEDAQRSLQPIDDSSSDAERLNFVRKAPLGSQRKRKANLNLDQHAGSEQRTKDTSKTPVSTEPAQQHIVTIKRVIATKLPQLKVDSPQTQRNKVLVTELKQILKAGKKSVPNKAVERLRKQLKLHRLNEDKFERMLRYYPNQDAIQQLGRLLVKLKMIKLMKQNPNLSHKDFLVSLKVNEEGQTFQTSDENKKEEILGLLKIIDKNKFKLEESKQKPNLKGFSMEQLTFKDIQDIAQDDFNELDITVQVESIINMYQESTKDFRRGRNNQAHQNETSITKTFESLSDKLIDRIQEVTTSINEQILTPSSSNNAQKTQVRLSLVDAFNTHSKSKDLRMKKASTLMEMEDQQLEGSFIKVKNGEISSSSKSEDQSDEDEESDSEEISENIKLKKKSVKNLNNLKYVKGDSQQQQLDDFFKKDERPRQSDPHIIKKLLESNSKVKLRRQSEFMVNEDDRDIIHPLQKREHVQMMQNEQQDTKKVSNIPNFSLSKNSENLDDEENDSVGLGHFFKGTSAQDLDKILSQDPSYSIRRRAQLLEQSGTSKVIEEERESDSTLGNIDHFKIAQMYTTKGSPTGLKSTALNSMTTHTRTVSQSAGGVQASGLSFLNTKIRFKGQPIIDIHRSTRDHNDPKYSTLTSFEVQKSQYDKFMLKTQPETQANQFEDLQLKQDKIEDVLDIKKNNLKYYCEKFGNPKSKPYEFKFSNEIKGMTPYHVIKMGQILGIMKKNKNETYLLWISQQALILTQPTDQRYENYNEIIHLMQIKQHPAFEYLCQVIYFQRKHFNQEVKKQLNQDKYKKDCSWLAFVEDAFDLKTQTKLGEKTYYYNFVNHQRTNLVPEALFSANNVPKHDTQQSKKILVDIERTFDEGVMKTIRQILIKRARINDLKIERRPSIKKHERVQSLISSPRLSLKKETSVNVKWTRPLVHSSSSAVLQTERNYSSHKQQSEGHRHARTITQQFLPNLLNKQSSNNLVLQEEKSQIVSLVQGKRLTKHFVPSVYLDEISARNSSRMQSRDQSKALSRKSKKIE